MKNLNTVYCQKRTIEITGKFKVLLFKKEKCNDSTLFGLAVNHTYKDIVP